MRIADMTIICSQFVSANSVSFAQPANARAPISLAEACTRCNCVHPSKTAVERVTEEDAISTVCRFSQPRKAACPMDFTEAPRRSSESG